MSNDAGSDRNSRMRGSRLGRLSKLGRLAGGVAGGVLSEGARQWSQGNRPSLRDLMLTPGNVGRVANQLSQLRGAAMKVGQLVSMDAGHVLPEELSELLSRLRSQADAMPGYQVRQVLSAAWGPHWQNDFEDFNHRPIAAASIGQVHKAVTRKGHHLAIKVQYPGVGNSINSDVDNVATLLRMSRLLPAHLSIGPLLEEAKIQLHAEADYQVEADYMQAFRELITDAPHFVIPTVDPARTTHTVLTMSYMPGSPVDQLTSRPQAVRDQVVTWLFELFFRELFEFQLVQTDPNFANFLYQDDERRIVLLDFGASRRYRDDVVAGYRGLLRGALDDDESAMFASARRIGYFSDQVTPTQQATVLSLFRTATEPLRHDGVYDFTQADLATRVRDIGMRLSFEEEYWHSPPVDALFLHRKLAGLYLLAVRLRARVDLRPMRAWLTP